MSDEHGLAVDHRVERNTLAALELITLLSAVAEPTLWSQTIPAWPSFALVGADELLMRHFRADVIGAQRDRQR